MERFLGRVGRLLLQVLPRGFRDHFGDEVAHHFRSRSAEIRARDGRLGVIRFWVRGFSDVVVAAMAERREERRMKKTDADGRILADLGSDIRFAIRTLRRTPGFTAVALLTLALGIGSSTAMFSVLNCAMGRDLPFPQPDRLVMGRAAWGGEVNPWVSFPDYMDYRDQAASLESLATIIGGWEPVTVTGSDEPREVNVTYVSQNLFQTLGVAPQLGGSFTIDEAPRSGGGEVMISHGFWQSWFGGDPDVVGRALSMRGNPLTVMGVMPPGFRFIFDTDLWVPPWAGNSDPRMRRAHEWLLVGRLAQGATLETARAEVDVISRQLEEAYPETNQGKTLQLDGLHAALAEGYRQALFLLVAATVLLLLIACGNVANLILARGTTRMPELAIRAAMGAGRARITRQLLVECLILALAAGGIGVVLAVWLQDALLGFMSMDMLSLDDPGLSPAMLGIALTLSLMTLVLFGLVPSLTTSRANHAANLKEGSRGSTSGHGSRFRSGLVVAQVALSLVLLVGSGLLIQSFARLRAVDPGFRVENLLTGTVAIPADAYPEADLRTLFFGNLRDEIAALPGVETVAMVSRLPILQGGGNVAVWAPERPPETNTDAPWADQRIVLPGYFGTMEIPLVEGRDFQDSDSDGSPRVIILTRTTAETVFPEESWLGRQVAVEVRAGEPTLFEVVGVVEDHELGSLGGSRRLAMFFPYAQRAASTMRIAVGTTVDPATLIRPIQERIWGMERSIVLSQPRTMAAALSSSISGFRSISTVLGSFAAVAMALAALGLYGVLGFFVTRRMHEIGIRVALGASGGSVLGMVVRKGMLLVAVGVALGIAGALGLTRFLADMLFQTEAIDLATYSVVTGLFLVVALGACLLPAWRAIRVDPVVAFRAD